MYHSFLPTFGGDNSNNDYDDDDDNNAELLVVLSCAVSTLYECDNYGYESVRCTHECHCLNTSTCTKTLPKCEKEIQRWEHECAMSEDDYTKTSKLTHMLKC